MGSGFYAGISILWTPRVGMFLQHVVFWSCLCSDMSLFLTYQIQKLHLDNAKLLLRLLDIQEPVIT